VFWRAPPATAAISSSVNSRSIFKGLPGFSVLGGASAGRPVSRFGSFLVRFRLVTIGPPLKRYVAIDAAFGTLRGAWTSWRYAEPLERLDRALLNQKIPALG
jgi:hypothetical protein